MINLSLIAIPGVVLLILLEYFFAGKKKASLFNFRHTVSNMSHGIFERFAYILLSLLYFFPYKYIQENFGIFEIEKSVYTWVLLIVVMDFFYYWYHRLGHTVNFFWAGHIVHHQSETFNISTGARITAIQSVYRFFFYAPIPLLGFPIEMIMAGLVFHGMFSLFAHTQLIGKLGFLEYIFITPSHHRVHHANNDEYLDKNYGNVFIFWDYIFGTYQKEERTPTFGLTKQIENYDFVYGNFHFYYELYYAVKEQKTFKDKWKVLFGSPTLLTGEEREKVDEKFKTQHDNKDLSTFCKINIQIRLVVILALSSILVGYHKDFNSTELVLAGFALFGGLYQLGKLMEYQRIQIYTEVVVIIASIALLSQGELLLSIPAAILILLSCLSFINDYWLSNQQKGGNNLA